MKLTSKTFQKFTNELKQELLTVMTNEGLTQRKLSEIVGLDKGSINYILNRQSKYKPSPYTPVKSQRLNSYRRIFKSLNKPIKIHLSKSNSILDLCEDETITHMKDRVLGYLQTTSNERIVIDETADLSRGHSRSMVRDPDHYLTTAMAIHCYSCWIEDVVFVST